MGQDMSTGSRKTAQAIPAGLVGTAGAKEPPLQKSAESPSTSLSWEELQKQRDIKKARLLIEWNLPDRSSMPQNKMVRVRVLFFLA